MSGGAPRPPGRACTACPGWCRRSARCWAPWRCCSSRCTCGCRPATASTRSGCAGRGAGCRLAAPGSCRSCPPSWCPRCCWRCAARPASSRWAAASSAASSAGTTSTGTPGSGPAGGTLLEGTAGVCPPASSYAGCVLCPLLLLPLPPCHLPRGLVRSLHAAACRLVVKPTVRRRRGQARTECHSLEKGDVTSEAKPSYFLYPNS